jgi:alpha-ribazole phosphatase
MRHPPSDAGNNRCIGQTDINLSAEGRAALPRLVEEAYRLRPDRIFCSDLQRCQLLAEAIAARLGLIAEPDPIWREMSFGRWENRTWSDIGAREPEVLGEWMTNFDTVAPPEGESFAQLQARILTGINARCLGDMGVPPVSRGGPNTGGTPVSHYLVVTHAGAIRAAVCAFSGLPLRKAFEVAIAYGSRTSFCWSGNHWRRVDSVAAKRTPLPERIS